MTHLSRKRLDLGPVLQGQASIYSRGNRLYTRLPDNVGLGRNKYLSLDLPNTSLGISQAIRITTAINSDIIYGNFDPSLNKYRAFYTRRHAKAVESLIGADTALQDLWVIYCEFQAQTKKASTLHYLTRTIGDKIKECNQTNINNAAGVYEWLLSNTTPKYTLRVLQKINLLFDWAIDRDILPEGANPYPRLIRQLKESKDVISKAHARPLTAEEQDHVINQITPIYVPLIKLQLLLGCRPSEAIGLYWEDLHIDDGYITLGRSYVKKSSVVLESELSKTNKTRQFPINEALAEFLQSLPRLGPRVVCYKDAKPFNYNRYFKAWKKVMPQDTTPYSCRDTFISKQIELGIPPAVVAQWCDNSVAVIEKHYLRISNATKPF